MDQVDRLGASMSLPLIAVLDVHGQKDEGNDNANDGEHRYDDEQGHADARRRYDHGVAIHGRTGATWSSHRTQKIHTKLFQVPFPLKHKLTSPIDLIHFKLHLIRWCVVLGNVRHDQFARCSKQNKQNKSKTIRISHSLCWLSLVDKTRFLRLGSRIPQTPPMIDNHWHWPIILSVGSIHNRKPQAKRYKLFELFVNHSHSSTTNQLLLNWTLRLLAPSSLNIHDSTKTDVVRFGFFWI